MNSSKLTRSLLLGVCIAIVFLLLWEKHWRNKGYVATPEDNKQLWAHHRAGIDDLDSNGVVLIGSSRVMFDFQLDEWERETGIRPVMLATVGSSPIPVFKEIVEQSKFKGTLVVGVTPPLYYSPPTDEDRRWARSNNWVKYFHKRTYADRFTHWVSMPLQETFSFLNASEEVFYNELDLRTLLETLSEPTRVHGPPPFPMFQYIDKDRNVTMIERMKTDTSYARMVTDFWSFVIQPPPEALPPPEVIEENRKGIIRMTTDLVERFESRGGKVIFVRCPSQNLWRAVENGGFPRANYWDELVESTGSPNYHFEDYDFMNKYILPEWSHLASDDAKIFTIDVVKQMLQDGAL